MQKKIKVTNDAELTVSISKEEIIDYIVSLPPEERTKFLADLATKGGDMVKNDIQQVVKIGKKILLG